MISLAEFTNWITMYIVHTVYSSFIKFLKYAVIWFNYNGFNKLISYW